MAIVLRLFHPGLASGGGGTEALRGGGGLY
ncbi:MAG: hypothetical protein RLZZ367_2012 [Bacteroidota bacterium]|jgi:hypothetical protein